MAEQRSDQNPSWRDVSTWLVLFLSVAFLMIGVALVLAPGYGALLFGIAAPDEPARAYVRALGFRDLGLALYIAGLTWFSTRRAVSIVLGASVIIPLCDIALVWWTAGLSSPGSLVLHAGGAASLTLLALWMGGGAERRPIR
jgi:hypothetical protein